MMFAVSGKKYPGAITAKLAFEIMMKRGWHVRRATTGEWVVYIPGDGHVGLETMVYMEDAEHKLVWAENPYDAILLANELYSRESAGV